MTGRKTPTYLPSVQVQLDTVRKQFHTGLTSVPPVQFYTVQKKGSFTQSYLQFGFSYTLYRRGAVSHSLTLVRVT